jgi:hypothetical protein
VGVPYPPPMRRVVVVATLALAACDRTTENVSAPAAPSASSLPVFGDRFAPPPEDQRKAIDVAVGGATSCAVLESGSVWCWGSDASGELGWDMPLTFNEPSRVVPTRVEGISGATRVAVDRGQACAIVADGAVRCWGARPARHQLMLGERVLARDVEGLRGVVQIALGDGLGCALAADGVVHCWEGVAGDVTGPTRVRDVNAVELAALPPYRKVVCLRRREGGAVCGALDRAGIAAGAPFRDLAPMRGGERAIDLDMHWPELCAVRDEGEVACWTLAAETRPAEIEPVVRSGPSDAVEVSGRCTRTAAGSVRCKAVRTEDADITLQGITRLAASSHACAVDGSGAVRCWGSNGSGQLANGRRTGSGPATITW